MSAPRPRASAAATTGFVLVVLGVLLWALYRYAAGHERHAFTPGRPPAHDVALTAGTTYHLAVRGGVSAAARVGVTPQSLRCSAERSDATVTRLSVSAEPADTKATDQIASFTAPINGRAHVTCQGLAEVYVDNASGDPSGYLLVLATVALTVGAPLLLSGLRRPAPAGSARADDASADELTTR